MRQSSKKKKIKIRMFLLALIIVANLFLGIGYAQISDIELTVEGNAIAMSLKEILITNIEYVSNNNADEALSTINDPYLTVMNSTITLGNTLDSTITYKVKIKNNTSFPASYDNALYSTSTGYDNEDITFTVNGISHGEILNGGAEKEITITFKYADNLSTITNNTLNSYINFKFDIISKTAKIGDTYYDTLQEAINAVPKTNVETTVELLKDTTEALTVDTNQNINFKLNSNTVSNNAGAAVFTVKGTMKLSDGFISTNSTKNSAINLSADGKLYMSGGKIISTGAKQAIYNDKGYVEISGNSYLENQSKDRATVQNLGGSTLVITGGTIVSKSFHAVHNEGTFTIGVEDGNPDETTPVLRGEKYGVNSTKGYNFYNGILKGYEEAINNINNIQNKEPEYDLALGTETIDGKNYKIMFLAHVVKINFNPSSGISSETSRNAAIGKPIGILPTAARVGYTFDGWYTEQTGGTKIDENTVVTSEVTTYYAHWTKIVYAEMDGVVYDTIKQAIDVVPTDGTPKTIKILNDVTENLTTQAGQNITFDLQGHTINNYNGNAVLENQATVTITNGTIETNSNSTSAINNNGGGSVILDSVTILSTGDRQAVYNLSGGTVTITGNSYFRSNASGNSNGSSLGRATVQNLAGGTMNILSGTIVCTTKQAIANDGTLNIGTKDGTVYLSKPTAQGATYGVNNNGILNFYDGKLKGKTSAINGTTSDLETSLTSTTETIDGENYFVQYNQ